MSKDDKSTLNEHMSCNEGMKIILAGYYDSIRSCEAGIIEDTDEIFLHDFREFKEASL